MISGVRFNGSRKKKKRFWKDRQNTKNRMWVIVEMGDGYWDFIILFPIFLCMFEISFIVKDKKIIVPMDRQMCGEFLLSDIVSPS